jgi:lipoprotein-anchoring transpeptidase ErfK/SrfK
MAPMHSADREIRRARAARRPAGSWARFVRRFGWRAYALPILVVITVAALVRSPGGGPSGRAANAGEGHRSTVRVAGAPAPAGAGFAGTQVAGLGADHAGYRAGLTPSPVVVALGADETTCARNTYAQLVLVSISRQHLWACAGARQVNSSAVTTGKVLDNDQTPLGSWRVQAKQRDRYLVGPGYRDYVRYWVPFDGDFGLHDASWQTMPFGSKQWRTGGSHGCVHTPTPVMAWIYHWVRPGTTVVTVEA